MDIKVFRYLKLLIKIWKILSTQGYGKTFAQKG